MRNLTNSTTKLREESATLTSPQGEVDNIASNDLLERESLHETVRSLKGLRIQMIPIWDHTYYIPHIVNLLREDWNEELENLLSRSQNTDCRYMIISLAVFLLMTKL